MIKQIVGGVVVLVIGGTTYTISQTDVADNLAKETGMSQTQAQKYVADTQNHLESFTKIGSDLVKDGNSILDVAYKIDCVNYQYEWESSLLSCDQGKQQIQTIGTEEVKLGECYQSLGADLGDASEDKIQECMQDIDTANSSYNLPIASKMLDSSDINDFKTSNLYNKSVFKAAIEHN